METDSAADLIPKLKAGDEAAHEELVRRYGPRMLTAARRLLRNEEDARDALQEAFLSAFRALPEFREEAELGTWLHRIVINAALMRLRKLKREQEISVRPYLPQFSEDGHVLEPITPPSSEAGHLAQRRETREQVRELIDQLPEKYRTVLLLRDIEELSTEETAQRLKVSQNVVKTRLHRARQALRTRLIPKIEEDQP